jgi:hypothetical protein
MRQGRKFSMRILYYLYDREVLEQDVVHISQQSQNKSTLLTKTVSSYSRHDRSTYCSPLVTIPIVIYSSTKIHSSEDAETGTGVPNLWTNHASSISGSMKVCTRNGIASSPNSSLHQGTRPDTLDPGPEHLRRMPIRASQEEIESTREKE